MPPAPVFSVPKFGAICIGALCFVVIYALFYWAITEHLSPTIVITLFYSMFLVPGFVLGLVARSSPVLYGLILGILAPAITPLESILISGVTDFPPLPMIFRMVRDAVTGYWLLYAVILYPLGAMVGSYAGRKMRGL